MCIDVVYERIPSRIHWGTYDDGGDDNIGSGGMVVVLT